MGRSKRKGTRSSLRGYSPGLDHEDLILEAIEIWSYGPGTLSDPAKALSLQQEMNRVREESLEHMERLHQAFLYEVENGDPGEGPFYRGHDGTKETDENTPLSWSRDPEIAFMFASTQPSARGPQGIRGLPPLETILEEGLELEEGEGLYLTVFVGEGAERGKNINHKGQELLQESTIKALEEGQSLHLHVLRGHQTETIHFDAEKFKRKVYLAALRLVGEDRLRAALGVGDLSGDQMVSFISRRSLAQMNAFLKRLGQHSISKMWHNRIEQIRSAIKDAESVTPASQYLSEEEVVCLDSQVLGKRRRDICLASSSAEIEALTEERAEEIFLQEIRKVHPTR